MERTLADAERDRLLHVAEAATDVPPVVAALAESWLDEARGAELYQTSRLDERLEFHDYVDAVGTVELVEPGVPPIGFWEDGANLLRRPVFYFTGVTGPGSFVVAAGDDDDPPVNDLGGTFSLAAMRLSRYFVAARAVDGTH